MNQFLRYVLQLILILITFVKIDFSLAETVTQIKKIGTTSNQDLYNQLTETQQKSKYLQNVATRDALFFSQQAAMKYRHGSECQLSCPLGCCKASEGLMYEGGLLMVLNQQATQTAKDSVVSGQQACATSNQISTLQKNCDAEIKSFDLTTPEPSWLDSTGKCKSSAPSECSIVMSMPGSKIFIDSSVNCKAAGGCSSDFYSTYKTNSDGSVAVALKGRTIKLTMDSFKDAQKLIAAGVPPDYADTLAARFQSAKASMEYAVPGSSTQVAVTSAGNGLTVAEGAEKSPTNAWADTAYKGGGAHPDFMVQPKREVSSERLTIDYHGDRIHVNSVNLFEAISARYKEKTATFFPAE